MFEPDDFPSEAVWVIKKTSPAFGPLSATYDFSGELPEDMYQKLYEWAKENGTNLTDLEEYEGMEDIQPEGVEAYRFELTDDRDIGFTFNNGQVYCSLKHDIRSKFL